MIRRGKIDAAILGATRTPAESRSLCRDGYQTQTDLAGFTDFPPGE